MVMVVFTGGDDGELIWGSHYGNAVTAMVVAAQ